MLGPTSAGAAAGARPHGDQTSLLCDSSARHFAVRERNQDAVRSAKFKEGARLRSITTTSRLLSLFRGANCSQGCQTFATGTLAPLARDYTTDPDPKLLAHL